MKERIGRLLKLTSEEGSTAEHLPVSGTFHSICVRILRRDVEHIGRDRGFVIYDSDDQEKVMREVLREMHIGKDDIKPRAALSHIGRFKSEAIPPDQARGIAGTHTEERAAEIYSHYQTALRRANAMDFDDLLLETIRLFRECPDILERYQRTWKYIHVDEYQDTNRAQYLLVSMLAHAHRNLYVIGDPDQSIYAFRGADIRNILDFQREYPDAVAITLDRNYRSTQQILDAANAIIVANPNRPEKNMWTDKTDGQKVSLREASDERREAEEVIKDVLERKRNGMSLRDQVVLYRTNAQSRLFEEACLRAGIPYRIFGGVKFYARMEVKDVLAYLHVIVNPHDTVSMLRIINVPSRKIGETTIGRLRNFCNERNLSLWQAMGHIGMVEGINEGTKQRLETFASLLSGLKGVATTVPVSELVASVVERAGIERYLRDNTEEGEERWQNVLELLSVTRKYDHLPPELPRGSRTRLRPRFAQCWSE
jgi:DNA helicase-2/ATP-dependent DNA helicase PcrA